MSRLRIFNEGDGARVIEEHAEGAAIAARLSKAGVRFERWATQAQIRPGAAPEQVIDAYRADIDRLMREGGYQAADVVSLHPEHPDRDTLRRKFLNEHTHAEDEVRFFVGGSGLFTLHIGAEVFEVLCCEGDLISVPAGTRHWFDMGAAPSFIAIRIFTNPEGWVAQFTGDPIAERFPRYQTDQAA